MLMVNAKLRVTVEMTSFKHSRGGIAGEGALLPLLCEEMRPKLLLTTPDSHDLK
jgi:hypothetical protein